MAPTGWTTCAMMLAGCTLIGEAGDPGGSLASALLAPAPGHQATAGS